MKIERVFANANKETFKIRPIKELIMKFTDVVDEIRIRLNIKGVQWLDIYFRGKDRITIFENIQDLLEQKDTIKIDVIERYSICNSPCIRISISKKPNFKMF